MDENSSYQRFGAIISDFRDYYASATLIPVGGFKFRHIRLRSMTGIWKGLRRDIVNAATFRRVLIHWLEPPRDLYTTVLRFLFPKELRHQADGVPCLGGPLVFDFDSISKYTLPSQVELERTKREILLLKDWLHATYGYRNFLFVFSGHRGFHLYVNDFNVANHVERVNLRHREAQEKRIRTRIAYTAFRDGFPIDVAITGDTRRIIRIPNSLHGRTGLKTILLPDEKALAQFHLCRAIFFSNDPVPLQITTLVPPFCFVGQTYGAFLPGQHLVLPKAVAYLLILSNYALANATVPDIERSEADEVFLNTQLEELARER